MRAGEPAAPLLPGAALGVLGDFVPFAVGQALGVRGGGNSLDNTLRIVDLVPTEWVLLDLRPNLAVGGYGHGVANVWTQDGHLLGVASQTASLLSLGIDPLTGFAGHVDELRARTR